MHGCIASCKLSLVSELVTTRPWVQNKLRFLSLDFREVIVDIASLHYLCVYRLNCQWHFIWCGSNKPPTYLLPVTLGILFWHIRTCAVGNKKYCRSAAGMPVKLKSSQLCRHAGRPLLPAFSVLISEHGYVGRSAAYIWHLGITYMYLAFIKVT